jgi:hypothetical protein
LTSSTYRGQVQERGGLPAGDPERLTALLRATAHGAADLTLAGHLSPDGKGHADATGLVNDLLSHLAASQLKPGPAPSQQDQQPRRQ